MPDLIQTIRNRLDHLHHALSMESVTTDDVMGELRLLLEMIDEDQE